MSENLDPRPEDTSAVPPTPPVPPMPDASTLPVPEAVTEPVAPLAAPEAVTEPVAPLAAPGGAAQPTAPTVPLPPSSAAVPPAPPAATAPYGQPALATAPAYAGAGFGVAAPPTAPPLPAAFAPAPRKKSSAGKVVGLLVAAALVGGAAGLGGAWAGTNLWAPVSATPAAGPATITVNNPQSVNATTAIAAKVVPSVVTVNVTGSNSGGTGSGVVLTADGYILTNTHVVTLDGESGSASVSVTTSDGHIYAAKVVGTDPVYDLAVIKIDATGLTPITWGDSGKLNVGDPTMAVGAPLGLSNTVTTGIVSALNRSIEIASSAAPKGGQSDSGNGNTPFYFDFGQGQQPQRQQAAASIQIAVIQTDAPINPGNSGGALVDAQGRLVGINVAIASTGSTSSSSQSGSIGVGFSIPSDIAHRIANDLMSNGKATHGLLGASVRDAAGVQGATITGAQITQVTSGGAAAKAGMQPGDIVTGFNGVPIGGAVDLTAQVRAVAAGGTANLTYVRGGQTLTAQVTLGALSQ